jgi:hypothetical protein
MPDYSYLDTAAQRLKTKYPHCKQFILHLLDEYKSQLIENTKYHGETTMEVIEDFRDDVRRRCHKKKALPKPPPRKPGRK